MRPVEEGKCPYGGRVKVSSVPGASVEGAGKLRRHSTSASSRGQQKRLDLAIVAESEWSNLRNSVPSASPTWPMSTSCNSGESANRFFASSHNDLGEDEDEETVTETPI